MNGTIVRNSNKVAYGIKKFVIDKEADIKNLPIHCTIGSTAFVIETSNSYILDNNYHWVKIISNNGTTGGDTEQDVHVIYDGGQEEAQEEIDLHLIYDGGGV